MKLPVKDSALTLKQFLLSQYFYDGLKITFGVVLPSIICYQFNLLETGITLSLGALYVSITDNPGPVLHKRNAMLATNACIFMVALLVGFTNHDAWLLAMVIPVCCFIFSMFTVYGARASAVGIAALLVLVIGIDQKLSAQATLMHATLLLAGGLWYTAFSLSLYQVIPYRPAEQTLGECIHKVAGFIRLKADLYEPSANLQHTQEELIGQQVLIHQELDNVREILFKTRKLLKDSSAQGNRLIITFIDVVDLYEQTMESHYPYDKLRAEYGHLPVLHTFHHAILAMSRDLEYIGTCIHNHENPHHNPQATPLLETARLQLDALEQSGTRVLVLRKIWVNMRNVAQRISQVYTYQQQAQKLPAARKSELNSFITHQRLDLKLFRDNLSLRSAVFRHALRVAMVCLAAFVFARNFYNGHHSYWILLTVIVILKPGFSQTQKRNYERIIGTVAGGLLGILILYWVKDVSARFWLLLAFMLLSYSFARIRYVVSVFFMTPFILIMFSFIGHNNDMLLVRERIMDTFIGAGIATFASYFIFPAWESKQIRAMMADMLLRNVQYLQSVVLYNPVDITTHSAYRLARKQMYVSTSNLASALQRMLNEPKRKRQDVNELNKFISLNNLFSAQVATLSQQVKDQQEFSPRQLKELRKVFHLAGEAAAFLPPVSGYPTGLDVHLNVHTGDSATQEFSTLVQVASDIKKLCAQLENTAVKA